MPNPRDVSVEAVTIRPRREHHMPVTKRVRFEVLRRDNHTCHYCGARAPEVAITIDHVVPVALGGSDNWEFFCFSSTRRWIARALARAHRAASS